MKRTVFYAVALLVAAVIVAALPISGEEKIYGELTPYSIEAYALQRLSESNVNPYQAELYYNVLRYALAADAVLNEDDRVEDNYVIFFASGMTFGASGATVATVYDGTVPFNPDECVITDASGKVVETLEGITKGAYTVSPKN